MSDSWRDDWVLEINGLEHHLYDPQRGEEFVVRVEQPLRIACRSLVAILGPSGCGKTTLLTILGLLRAPSHPERLDYFRMYPSPEKKTEEPINLKEVWLAGQRHIVERLRRQHVGFALQSGELLAALTVRENIAMPLWLNGITGEPCWQRVQELLDVFRLNRPTKKGIGLAYSRVNKLSGGEYQRVSLARAIVHRPTLVFVDEPTAALNRELAWEALVQLRTLQRTQHSHGATLMITHDEQLALAFADLIVRMAPVPGQAAGRVVEVAPNVPTQDDAVPPASIPLAKEDFELRLDEPELQDSI